MIRTALTVRNLPRGGANLVTEPSDQVNGNYFQFSGAVTLLLSFFSVSGGSVTIASPVYVDGDQDAGGLKVPDRVLILPPATVFLWTCPVSLYSQFGLNQVFIDAAQPTSIAVYQF